MRGKEPFSADREEDWFSENVPARRGSRLCDSSAGSLPAPSCCPQRSSRRRGLAGDPTQRPRMRRKRDRPQRPLGLGVQGTCWPRRVLTAPPPRLELREAPRSRWGWGRPSPRMVEGQSPFPAFPAPDTPASSLGGDTVRTGCVRGASADRGGVDGAAQPGRGLDVPKTQGAFHYLLWANPGRRARRRCL